MENKTQDVVIAGFGVKVPMDIKTVDEFWKMLVSKKCSIGEIPENRIKNFSDENFNKLPSKGGFFNDIDKFDNEYFAISPKVAKDMDPQQRMALETTVDAIQDSLVDLKFLQSIKTGVFVGAGSFDYLSSSFKNNDLITQYTMQGGTIGNIANVVSFYLNLNGISLTMDTACSSSMTALHIADSKIKNGELDAAIVIGSNVILSMDGFVGFSNAKLLSKNGKSLPFHKDGEGFVRADGCISTLLMNKKLLNHQQLINSYAELFRTGANENGRNVSLTTPCVKSQYNLLNDLLKDVEPSYKITFVEAHGTGTKVGDPIEFESVSNVLKNLNYSTDNLSIPISSVKGNIGHMETASGMAGLLKACLSIKYNMFPCGPHLNNPDNINVKIKNMESSLRVILDHETFEKNDKNLFIVNSFGYGGANACAILKNTSITDKLTGSKQDSLSCYKLLCLSANSIIKLDDIERRVLSSINKTNIDQIISLQNNKTKMGQYKRVVLFEKMEEEFNVIKKMDNCNDKNKKLSTAFVFSGQGSQYPEMGKYLYNNYEVFSSSVNELDTIYKELSGISLVKDKGFCSHMKDVDITDVNISTMIITIIQIATVDLLNSFGIVPDYVMGHSTGEISAFYSTGLVEKKNVIKETYVRALCQDLMPEGRMMAALMNENEFNDLKNKLVYDNDIFISAINSKNSLTLAGTKTAIDEFYNLSIKHKYKTIILKNIEKAFHSPHTNVCKDLFFEKSNFDIKHSLSSKCNFVSSVDGKIKTKEEILSTEYWWKNINMKVEFLEATNTLSSLVNNIIEISPNNILNKYLITNIQDVNYLNLSKIGKESQSFYQTLSYMYLYSEDVNLSSLHTVLSFDNYRTTLNTWKHDESIKSLSWEKQLNEFNFETTKKKICDLNNKISTSNYYELTKEHDVYLKDHVINGNVILPGALFISKALTMINSRTEMLNDITFASQVKWNIETNWNALNWEKNKIIFFDNSCIINKTIKSVDQPDFKIEEGMIRSIDISKYYKYLNDVNIKFGPRFKLLSDLYHTPNYKFVRCKVEYKEVNDIESTWNISPSVIDAGFQMCGYIIGIYEKAFVPYKVKTVSVELENYNKENITIESLLTNIVDNKYIYDINYLSNGKVFMRVKELELMCYLTQRSNVDIFHEVRVLEYEKNTIFKDYDIQDLSSFEFDADCLNIVNKWCKLKRNIVFIISKKNVGVLLGMIRAFRKEYNKKVKIILNFEEKKIVETDVYKILSSNFDMDEFEYSDQKITTSRFFSLEPSNNETEYRVELTKPGNLSSLSTKGIILKDLKLKQVLIETKYVSLHFKDVMLAMNMLPGFNPVLGLESLGVVKNVTPCSRFKVGDRVICLDFSTKNKEVTDSLLSSSVIYHEDNLIKIDEDIQCDESELVGYLGVMITAHYALLKMGNLSSEDTVLIHSALGGVGQSAIQVAKTVGAKIIASAGSDERRKHLSLMFDIPICDIIDSRKPENFVSEVNRITNGKGVNVVLNSLNGLSQIESIKCLAPTGRFIEIGKRDIMENNALNLNLLKENISFLSVHLDLLSNTNLEKIKLLCYECLNLLKNGVYKTIKSNVFNSNVFDIERALRQMSKGKHEGKNVIKFSQKVKTGELSLYGLYEIDKAYIYTGSTYGVGFTNMISNIKYGVRNIYILSSSIDGIELYKNTHWKNYLILKNTLLKYPDLNVNFIKFDLSNDNLDVKVVFDSIKQCIGGIFHFATTYNSQKNGEIDYKGFKEGFNAKTSIKYFLEYIYNFNISLDFVFIATSVAGLIGNDYQSVYCSANTYCYDLSKKYSFLLKKNVVCVDIPIVIGSGHLSEFKNYNEYKYNKSKKVYTVYVDLLCEKFNRIVSSFNNKLSFDHYLIYETSQINTLFENTQKTEFLTEVTNKHTLKSTNLVETPLMNNDIEAILITKLSTILGCSVNSISKTSVVCDLGLDSLGAVELSDWCKETFTVEMDNSFLLNPTIEVRDILNKLNSFENKSKSDVSNKTKELDYDVSSTNFIHYNRSHEKTEPFAEIKNKTYLNSTSLVEISSMNNNVEVLLMEKLSTILGCSVNSISKTSVVCDLGLDSLLAVELSDWCKETFKVEMDNSFLLNPTIEVRDILNKLNSFEVKGEVFNKTKEDEHDTFVESKEQVGVTIKETFASSVLDLKKNTSYIKNNVLYIKCFGHLSISVINEWISFLSTKSYNVIMAEVKDSVGMNLTNNKFKEMTNVLLKYEELIDILLNIEQPIVTISYGEVRGGSMCWILKGLINLSLSDTTFGFPEIRVGGIPSYVSILSKFRLSEHISKKMMLIGDIINSNVALNYNLIDEILDASDIEMKTNYYLNRLNKSNIKVANKFIPSQNLNTSRVALGHYMNEESSKDEDINYKNLIKYEVLNNNKVCLITINDKNNFNAMNYNVGKRFKEIICELKKNKNLVVVILQGDGKHFCTGLDTKQQVDNLRTDDYFLSCKNIYELYENFTSICELKALTISILTGTVVGGGLALALNTDLRIVSSDCNIQYGNLSRGVCPGLFLSKSMPDLIGSVKTLELYMNEKNISIDFAKETGIINYLVKNKEEGLLLANKIAAELLLNPNCGIQETSYLFRKKYDKQIIINEAIGMINCFKYGKPFKKVILQKENKLEDKKNIQINEKEKISQNNVVDVGIDCMEMYTPNNFILQEDMEKNDKCIGKYVNGLMQERICIPNKNEDSVSMALNVVDRLLKKNNIDKNMIGRIDVGTESQVDKSKSIKSYLMQLFKNTDGSIEGIDNVHACYGGTMALFNAVDWIYSPFWNRKYAVVVTTDIAVYDEPFKFLNGCAAVAMLIKPNSKLVIDLTRVSHCFNEHDFFKPLNLEFPIMNGKTSIEAMNTCLLNCLEKYDKIKPNEIKNVNFLISHCTSKLISKKVSFSVSEFLNIPIQDRNEIFNLKTEKSTVLVSKIGSMFTSALYVNLISLINSLNENDIGKDIMLFSYGSGSMSSLFKMKINGLPNFNKDLCNLLDEKKLNKCNVETIYESPDNLKEGCYCLTNSDNDGRSYKLL